MCLLAHKTGHRESHTESIKGEVTLEEQHQYPKGAGVEQAHMRRLQSQILVGIPTIATPVPRGGRMETMVLLVYSFLDTNQVRIEWMRLSKLK